MSIAASSGRAKLQHKMTDSLLHRRRKPAKARAFLTFALSLLVVFSPAPAQEPDTSWPVAVRADIARLGAAEFALRSAAGLSCRSQDIASGIKLDYIGAYAPEHRDIVRRSTGLGEEAQIVAVAPASPAAQAGLLPGDEIIAVSGTSFADMAAKSRNPGLLPDEVENLLARTAEGHEIVLDVRRNGVPHTFRFRGRRLCAARFYLKTDEGMSAYGDERNVAIGRKFLDFARNDDELAILAGHELAHIVAQDDATNNLRTRRAMEDRADLLGADLARCAGYDMSKGLELWRRVDERDWLKWLRAPSHRRASERIRRIEDHLRRGSPVCPPATPALSFD